MSVSDKPSLCNRTVNRLLKQIYGIDGVVAPLPGERDQNLLITIPGRGELVLKIFNKNDTYPFVTSMAALMRYLEKEGVPVPEIVPSLMGKNVNLFRDEKEGVDNESRENQRDGEGLEGLKDSESRENQWDREDREDRKSEESRVDQVEYIVILISRIDGIPYAEVKYHPDELLESIGTTLARTDRLLGEYSDPLLKRQLKWDIRNAPVVISSNLHLLKDNRLSSFCEETIDLYNKLVKPFDEGIRKSIIYNDANDYNIIVTPASEGGQPRLSGIVDFGDALYSFTIADLAVAIAYLILDRDDPLSVALRVVKGYNAELPLKPLEADILMVLVRARLAMSICIAAAQQKERPEDNYLTISQLPIERSLPAIEAVDTDLAAVMFRDACGLPIHEKFGITEKFLSENGSKAYPVMGIIPDESSFMVLDLSVEGTLISGDPEDNSEEHLSFRIRREMELAGVKVAVGRWCEPRILYTSALFSDSAFRERPDRSVHLGVDLFADAGLPLYAPFDGEIFIARYNPDHLDYGNMIILKHIVPEGGLFYTLYGHLSALSIKGKIKGDVVRRGEEFAWIGEPHENGGWAPHLHFQLIADIRRVDASFPGVCRPTETVGWRVLSPDPNSVLCIPLSLFPADLPSEEEVLNRRLSITGSNLSIAYRKPVVMSRGWMQYMFDSTGQKYLDAYNNVPHTGHCHPEVADALSSQSRLLATNTRYLSDAFNSYAELLLSTLPDSLNRVFLVNSGSEANELAIRLARAYTGQKDVVVLEGQVPIRLSLAVAVTTKGSATLIVTWAVVMHPLASVTVTV